VIPPSAPGPSDGPSDGPSAGLAQTGSEAAAAEATLAQALAAAVPRLRAAGVEDPAGDARRLLADAAGLPADRLTLHLPDPAPPATLARFHDHLARRLARQPVAQILGLRLFWGRSFAVTPDVLDPRPETEILVAAALRAPFRRVLDLGTGSGAILLSVLAERPQASGVGTDASARALAVARRNRGALGLQARAALRGGDWYGAVPPGQRFDLILSNPPYIAADELAGLAPEVRLWEPPGALSPGADGLAAYRVLVAGLGAHLLPGGQVLFEIGPTQAQAVSRLLAEAGLRAIEVLADLDGRPRVVAARAAGAAPAPGDVAGPDQPADFAP
jgi:release factor glutamine methyltransferase